MDVLQLRRCLYPFLRKPASRGVRQDIHRVVALVTLAVTVGARTPPHAYPFREAETRSAISLTTRRAESAAPSCQPVSWLK